LKTHKDLDVYKNSIELVKSVYALTRSFPKDELFGISSQMRRAAVSIPSNIAEGAARQSDREFVHFLYISLGSLSELDTQVDISEELKFIGHQASVDTQTKIVTIKQMLIGLIRSVKSRLP
jgi:four helix bundle protein